ncbi:DUF354 domain-containing protein [Nitrosopumilus sp.]|uniref:DUF354 domain-containing protein n=1 Tax=Nitrosopumilus sp. TaxID=2024843 RepID=UPI00292D697E|nr:DUF354 domain-containing protein [Nitrosopumilus sp.]
MRNFSPLFVGKYGGADKKTKFKASIDRIKKLTRKIEEFSPDMAISFCSPEAARISFGLGIKHVGFSDTPHADAVMRLTVPLIQKLLAPQIIPKNEFAKYGINKKNIIQYNALDAAVTIKRNTDQNKPLPFKVNKMKNILIRIEEEEAAYASKSNKIIPIIKQIISEHGDENIVILGRYSKQIQSLKKKFGAKAKIIKMSFDGKHLLNHTDIFIGSRGTMTAESALSGIPTISYNAVPNIVEKFLVRKKLIKREIDPKKIVNIIQKNTKPTNNLHKKRAKQFVDQMEDPIQKLIEVIRE